MRKWYECFNYASQLSKIEREVLDEFTEDSFNSYLLDNFEKELLVITRYNKFTITVAIGLLFGDSNT